MMMKTSFGKTLLLATILGWWSIVPAQAGATLSQTAERSASKERSANRISLYKKIVIESLGEIRSPACADLDEVSRGNLHIGLDGRVSIGKLKRHLLDANAMLGVTRSADNSGKRIVHVSAGKRGALAEESFVTEANWWLVIADPGDENIEAVFSQGRTDAYCLNTPGGILLQEKQFLPRLLPLLQAGAGAIACEGAQFPAADTRVDLSDDAVSVANSTYSLRNNIQKESVVVNPVLKTLRYDIDYDNGVHLLMRFNERGTLAALFVFKNHYLTLNCPLQKDLVRSVKP